DRLEPARVPVADVAGRAVGVLGARDEALAAVAGEGRAGDVVRRDAGAGRPAGGLGGVDVGGALLGRADRARRVLAAAGGAVAFLVGAAGGRPLVHADVVGVVRPGGDGGAVARRGGERAALARGRAGVGAADAVGAEVAQALRGGRAGLAEGLEAAAAGL